jgi:hypothetical protein
MHGRDDKCVKHLVRKPEGKRTLGRCRHRRGCRETEWEIVDWIYLAQDRDNWWPLVNMVMNL